MFQARKFIEDEFQGPEHMRNILVAYGFPALSKEGILKAVRRDSLSGKWLALLLGVLELERGSPVSILRYVKR